MGKVAKERTPKQYKVTNIHPVYESEEEKQKAYAKCSQIIGSILYQEALRREQQAQ